MKKQPGATYAGLLCKWDCAQSCLPVCQGSFYTIFCHWN